MFEGLKAGFENREARRRNDIDAQNVRSVTEYRRAEIKRNKINQELELNQQGFGYDEKGNIVRLDDHPNTIIHNARVNTAKQLLDITQQLAYLQNAHSRNEFQLTAMRAIESGDAGEMNNLLKSPVLRNLMVQYLQQTGLDVTNESDITFANLNYDDKNLKPLRDVFSDNEEAKKSFDKLVASVIINGEPHVFALDRAFTESGGFKNVNVSNESLEKLYDKQELLNNLLNIGNNYKQTERLEKESIVNRNQRLGSNDYNELDNKVNKFLQELGSEFGYDIKNVNDLRDLQSLKTDENGELVNPEIISPEFNKRLRDGFTKMGVLDIAFENSDDNNLLKRYAGMVDLAYTPLTDKDSGFLDRFYQDFLSFLDAGDRKIFEGNAGRKYFNLLVAYANSGKQINERELKEMGDDYWIGHGERQAKFKKKIEVIVKNLEGLYDRESNRNNLRAYVEVFPVLQKYKGILNGLNKMGNSEQEVRNDFIVDKGTNQPPSPQSENIQNRSNEIDYRKQEQKNARLRTQTNKDLAKIQEQIDYKKTQLKYYDEKITPILDHFNDLYIKGILTDKSTSKELWGAFLELDIQDDKLNKLRIRALFDFGVLGKSKPTTNRGKGIPKVTSNVINSYSDAKRVNGELEELINKKSELEQNLEEYAPKTMQEYSDILYEQFEEAGGNNSELDNEN